MKNMKKALVLAGIMVACGAEAMRPAGRDAHRLLRALVGNAHHEIGDLLDRNGRDRINPNVTVGRLKHSLFQAYAYGVEDREDSMYEHMCAFLWRNDEGRLNVTHRNTLGENVLHSAVRGGNRSVLAVLRDELGHEFGRLCGMRNNVGQTPSDLARALRAAAQQEEGKAGRRRLAECVNALR